MNAGKCNYFISVCIYDGLLLVDYVKLAECLEMGIEYPVNIPPAGQTGIQYPVIFISNQMAQICTPSDFDVFFCSFFFEKPKYNLFKCIF